MQIEWDTIDFMIYKMLYAIVLYSTQSFDSQYHIPFGEKIISDLENLWKFMDIDYGDQYLVQTTESIRLTQK